MAAIIRDDFKVKALAKFVEGVSVDSLYMGVARPQFWDTTSNIDTTVPVPDNTINGSLRDWEDMMSLKRVSASDISHGIFKESWQPNVKYDIYRHDWNGSITAVYNGQNASPSAPIGLGQVKCFVVTSTYAVYVCMKQKIIAGEVQPSIYAPQTGITVGVNTGIVRTADGYYWKYLAATSTNKLLKFSSKLYHSIETLTTAPAPEDTTYPQWTAQTTSALYKGGLYTINVVAAGTGYNAGLAGTRLVTNAETDAEFKIIGDGIGLTYTVTYGAAGSIADVEITNPGAGYTHASIVATTGTGAIFDIIFTPARGLGVNPVYDTVARFMLINIKLEGAEGLGDFTIENDYRKILLVYNPTNYGTSNTATVSTLNATTTLFVGTALTDSAYPIDVIITGATSGCKSRVVDFNSITGALRVIRTSSENAGSLFANNSYLVGESLTPASGTGGGVIGSITVPEVQAHSGDIIYSEYRAPILRSVDQSESINIIVKM